MFSSNQLNELMSADLSTHPHGQLYLIFDSSLHPDLLAQYFLLDEEPEFVPLFFGIEELLPISPYLIALNATTAAFVEWFQYHSRQWGFIFSSNHGLQALLGHWQSLLQVIIPTGNAPTFFRYYDGQVLENFLTSASTADIKSFFQPCNGLFYQTKDRQWHYMTIAQQQVSTPNDEPRELPGYKPPWFQLSECSYKHLLPEAKNTLKQDILQIAWHLYPEILERYPDAKIDVLLQEGINTAESLGLRSERQIALFICLIIEFHPQFYQHPRVAALYKEEKCQQSDGAMSRTLDRMQLEFLPKDWRILSEQQHV